MLLTTLLLLCAFHLSTLSVDVDNACPPGEFACPDGKCLGQAQVCDGLKNCEDASDESARTCPGLHINCRGVRIKCPNTNICVQPADLCDGYDDCGDGGDEQQSFCMSQQCPKYFVRCPSGRCIPEAWQCDGDSDCGEGEAWDETHANCTDAEGKKVCVGQYLFQCQNAKCISRAFICDGDDDCGDGSDESGSALSCGNRMCSEEQEFHCKSNARLERPKYECIPKTWLCNGEVNCADGADESEAQCGVAVTGCNRGEFRCSNNQCIKAEWECDGGKDCLDGSDEHNCTCNSGQWQCNNYKCIFDTWRCDGTDDCGDGSDEIRSQCPECEHDHFRCNATGRCIPLQWVCDGADDCGDGSDEVPSQCPECDQDKFRCNATGRCIPQQWVCDGTDDCGDGSDEIRSQCPECEHDHFRCNATGRCIPLQWVCDGADDCGDGSDEDPSQCPECDQDKFRCNATGRCIPQQWVCDGTDDCGDGSDETDELCGSTTRPCNESEFRCNEGRCILQTKVCDGKNQCSDGGDETDCVNWKCADGMRQCDDGICIPEKKWCDRRRDCANATDELNCEDHPDRRQCSHSEEFECANSVCVPNKFMCDGDNDCADNSDETNPQCQWVACEPPLRFRCAHSRLCLNILQLCNGVNDCGEQDHSDEHLELCFEDHSKDCGDETDESSCQSQNGSSIYCHAGFRPDPASPPNCVDVDECRGNNSCTQQCLNTEGSYLCTCVDDYHSEVLVGAMSGKDCRANGQPALLMVASNEGILQLDFAGPRTRGNTAVHAAKGYNALVAVEFDPRRELMFWLDALQWKVYRSALPKGNQSHEGQELAIHLEESLSLLAMSVDYLTGNFYISAVNESIMGLKEPHFDNYGLILVASANGRYRRKIVSEQLQVPTAIVTLPKLGRICYADAGSEAKIECADMDGNERKTIIKESIRSPTSLTVDEGRGHRLYWADTEHHWVDSCLPDGSNRLKIARDVKTPFAIDVFENRLYWASRQTQELYVQDKFGRGRITLLASGIGEVHAVRVQQRFARDMLRAESACAQANCSYMCVEMPNNGFRCLCPDPDSEGGSCGSVREEEMALPKQCACQNGGKCRVDGTCECGQHFEGLFCQNGGNGSMTAG